MSSSENQQSIPITRRNCLLGATTAALGGTLIGCSLLSSADKQHYTLVVQPQPTRIKPGTVTPTWTFNQQAPGPILRVRQNQPVQVTVINRLNEPTTIHWHGIRLNNAADGVPYLTQQPIAPGETFVYRFSCPDAGTFWYHPHTNSLEQLSRGLVGMLIVEEENPVYFDGELPLILKDWHLNDDGTFASFSDPRAAARTGTLGNYATVNGRQTDSPAAVFGLPAGGWSRVRIANVDNTRVYQIACDHPAQVIAVEGNPLARPMPLTSHPLGAGMRVDLAIKMPDAPESVINIQDMKGRFAFNLCELRSVKSEGQLLSEPPVLPMNPVTEIDLTQARRIPLVFEWAGALSPGFASGSGRSKNIALSEFWTINKRAWDGHGANLPAPLAHIKLGEHIVFELHNATPHHHPVHLHGYTFTVLSSNQREITPYHTDTVLMSKYERMEVAIVADNLGDWMFHCHVIEHMKTGLMGYIRVT